jgi:hypothetical protein
MRVFCVRDRFSPQRHGDRRGVELRDEIDFFYLCALCGGLLVPSVHLAYHTRTIPNRMITLRLADGLLTAASGGMDRPYNESALL